MHEKLLAFKINDKHFIVDLFWVNHRSIYEYQPIASLFIYFQFNFLSKVLLIKYHLAPKQESFYLSLKYRIQPNKFFLEFKIKDQQFLEGYR